MPEESGRPTKISLRTSVTVSSDAVSRDLEGEAVILNLASGTYFGLNEVGTRVWALIQQHKSLDRVFEVMREEYEVPAERLERDLVELVEQLRAKGLVHVSQAE